MGRLVKRLSVNALLLVFVLATSVFGQIQIDRPPEVLENGDFETWNNLTLPDGWTHLDNVTKDSANVHSGAYSAKHVGGTSDLAQYVTVVPGNLYTITLWCKVEAGDDTDARLWAYWKGGGSSIGSAIESPYFSATDNSDWSTWTTTVTAPEGAGSIYFELRTYSGATVYWDDLSIIESKPPVIPEDPADYFIPKGTHSQGYASLKAAVDSINIHGVSGMINLVLDADTLREESFTFNADLDADSNVTVKPAPGRDVVLIVTPGASHGNGSQMIGFEKGYVTFDGSNDGSDSRNLIVTTETNDTRVPFGLNSAEADNITIKNLIIKNLDNVATDFKYAVITNDVGGNNFTVDNCQLGSEEAPIWRDAVAVWGDWTNGATDAIVTNNEIHAGSRGISTYIGGTCEFNNNTVYLHPSASSYTYAYGIYISYVKSSEIMNNKIYGLEKTTTATKLIGIATASNPEGAVFTVANNMVVVGAPDETNSVYGFGMVSNSDQRAFNIYNNTFVVNDNSGTAASQGIGYHGATGAVNIDLKNNIIINNNTANAASSAISLGANATLSSNNNVLVSAQNLVNYHGTDYADLATWQAAGQDAGSVSKAVTFASDTDLHLAAPSDTDLDLAMPVIASVATDIDGDARSNIFYTYAGADEGSEYPDNDLNITFDDNSDVAFWNHYDEANAYTVEGQADSMLVLSDAGYGMIAKRPIKATVGSLYKLSIDIKTSLWEGANNTLDLSVQGLGNDAVSYSVITDSAWATFTIIGVANAEDGYIRIAGSKAGTTDTVFVDNLIWDDQYMDIIPSESIADAKAIAPYEWVACSGIVNNASTGAPIFMEDATAGISLYDWDFINNTDVKVGDEILVIGQRSDYKGLVQIQKTDMNFQILSRDNVVTPTLITVADLDSRAYQGMLVMITNVDTVDGFAWPAEGSDASINATTDGVNEFVIRIDRDSEIDGQPAPTSWPLDLIGVVGEYDVPQVMPRTIDDFLANQAPSAFAWINPVDGDTISTMDDPALITIPGDSSKALFANWTKAIDIDGDTVTYELMLLNESEVLTTTTDTLYVFPLNMDKPYEMNGTYTLYIKASDPMGEVSMSDTISITFDFEAPARIKDIDMVLVEGVPAMYVEYDLPILASPDNFKFVDLTDGGSTSTPTVLKFIDNSNTSIILSGNFVEDHQVALASSGVVTPAASLTVTDTSDAMTVYIPFSANHPVDTGMLIESFEGSAFNFKAPSFSGSTTGIISDNSSLVASTEEAFQGSKSGKITIADDPAVDGGWFVRMPYTYPYTKTVKSNSTLFLMVKGTGDVQLALTVKDNGYERNMWKSVSLASEDWQVVSFDLANDEVEGWITGDNAITGETVTICDLHIMSSVDEDAVLYIDGFTERQILEPVNVTLNVMMAEWLRQDKFNLATDYVDVAGSMNDWGSTPFILENFDTDTTYSITFPMMPYTSMQFKFRINGSWNDDTAEFPYGGPARELTIPNAASEFTYWYNNDTLVYIEPGVEDLPAEFALHQNYPNPFNPTTMIEFDLPEASDVSLVIYDITGRQVRTLVNETGVAAGYRGITWNGHDNNGNGVATGMYIYRLQAGDYVDVKKMTFMK